MLDHRGLRAHRGSRAGIAADSRTELLIPAPLDPSTTREIRRLGVAAFRAVDACGLARVDFFVERSSGRVLVNEINTMPGFTSISMYPKLFEAVGIPYRDLIDRLISFALQRHAEKQALTRSYTPKTEWYRNDR